MDNVIKELIDRSHSSLARGADRGHHRTYQDVVYQTGGWALDHDMVARMRDLYAESLRAEATGTPHQPTYRRGLVDVMAARMSENATRLAGRQVVISPAQARPVLDSRPATGARFTPDIPSDPDDIIEGAVAGNNNSSTDHEDGQRL
jgi:hypothetical protein